MHSDYSFSASDLFNPYSACLILRRLGLRIKACIGKKVREDILVVEGHKGNTAGRLVGDSCFSADNTPL